MKKSLLCAVTLVLAGLGANAPVRVAHAAFVPPPPPPPAGPFRVQRLDPALDNVLAPDVTLQLIGDRFGLTEGPVYVHDEAGGYLLISDLISNFIYKIKPDNSVSVFLDKAGYSGDDLTHAGTQTKRGDMNVLMIGPNGETLDSQGRLIWCASPDRTIMRLEKDGSRTVLAATYKGKKFNGPNDVVAKSDGAVYFTDSDFGLRDGSASPLKELDFNGVYMVKDGTVKLLINGEQLGGFPNGIALSPDEKHLYLNAGFGKMMRYDIQADDTIADGKEMFHGGWGIADGIKTDMNGNLYSTGGAGPGVVRVSSPTGKALGMIILPNSDKQPKQQICATNLAFGGPDGKTLYIAACEAVYKIRVKVPGFMPGPGPAKD